MKEFFYWIILYCIYWWISSFIVFSFDLNLRGIDLSVILAIILLIITYLLLKKINKTGEKVRLSNYKFLRYFLNIIGIFIISYLFVGLYGIFSLLLR